MLHFSNPMTLALALSLPSPQPHLLHPEEERAGKGSVGTDAQDGLAGKDKAAENDEAHRALVKAAADPRVPNQVLSGHFK